MDLQLQFGYGMRGLSSRLITRWGRGTVILSPRDLNPGQLASASAQFRGIGASVYVDPQFYLPRADHPRLTTHDYWPDDYETNTFFPGAGLTEMMTQLGALNRSLSTQGMILPGIMANEINDDWLAYHRAFLEEGARIHGGQAPVLPTFCVSSHVLRSEAQVHCLLDGIEEWPFETCYLVCEHPDGAYLIDDPTWIAGLLDLVGGLKLAGRRVILGYGHHQLLVAGLCATDAMASGTWMNVRSFTLGKFQEQVDDVKQRATWYYCPQAMSEYQLPYLDIAYRMGVLADMRPQPPCTDEHVAALFNGVVPTTLNFDEPTSFLHYLDSLKTQVDVVVRATYDDTVGAYQRSLDVAEALLGRLRASGVFGRLREFSGALDANRSAVAFLQAARGPMLRRAWNELL